MQEQPASWNLQAQACEAAILVLSKPQRASLSVKNLDSEFVVAKSILSKDVDITIHPRQIYIVGYCYTAGSEVNLRTGRTLATSNISPKIGQVFLYM